MRAGAFTLTELLVVLTILGLIVAITSIGAPRQFEQAALRQASAQLQSDLDRLATETRRAGAYGALQSEGGRYSISVNGQVLAARSLPSRVRLTLSPQTIAIDPAGRYSPGDIALESDAHEQVFAIDPVTGRATRAGHGPARSSRRRRDLERSGRGVSRNSPRGANRYGARAHARDGDSLGLRLARRNPPILAVNSTPRSALWNQGRVLLGDDVPGRRGNSEPPPLPDRMLGHGDAGKPYAPGYGRHSAHRLGGAASALPAMSLMEMLVALVVLSLLATLVFSSLGPWIAESRRASADAAFWRSVTPVHLTLAELTSGAIDVSAATSISVREVKLRTYAPRLGDAPIDVALAITEHDGVSQLVLTTPQTESLLLSGPYPLRFRPISESRVSTPSLALEMRSGDTWAPLAISPLRTNAPLVCVFDLISRTCR